MTTRLIETSSEASLQTASHHVDRLDHGRASDRVIVEIALRIELSIDDGDTAPCAGIIAIRARRV